jgi:tetrahydromethanopterin S-methyltransferase subunit H
MCGSIFYDGHKIVKDAVAGTFDEVAARELFDDEKKLLDDFGLQRMPDVIGDTVEALTKHVDFVLEVVKEPILVDSASAATLLETFKRYSGSEVMERLVYSPVDLHTSDEQFAEIKRLKIKNALVLAFSPMAIKPEQKLEVLLGKEWGDNKFSPDSLVIKSENAGIENMLIDVGVIDLQGTAWSAMSIVEVKEHIGLPAGCATSNALFSWQRTHKDTLKNSSQKVATGAAIYSAITYSGADFVLYGPLNCAQWAYPAIAVSDALVAYGNRLSGIRPKTATHPLKLLR